MRIEVNGIQGAYDKYGQEEFRGVKVHFFINENGLFGCTGAEVVFERVTSEQSAFDSILGYFSGSSDEGKIVEDNSTEQNETKSAQNVTEPAADARDAACYALNTFLTRLASFSSLAMAL